MAGAVHRGEALERAEAAVLLVEQAPRALGVARRFGLPCSARVTLFPTLNAAEIADLARLAARAGAEELEVLCECEQLDCVVTIALSLDDYRAARGEESIFIVAPGHQSPERARIVRETETYLLVEKNSA